METVTGDAYARGASRIVRAITPNSMIGFEYLTMNAILFVSLSGAVDII